MSKFIFIATTQGPVRVQAITEEDSDIRSVVCLDGNAEPLGISERYHDFVKKGTGLIHKKFSHGSYRVDVAERIDEGNSWQLGLYCAHLLHQRGELINAVPQAGDSIYFVSGSVKSTGEIIPVEKIPEKLAVAASFFQHWENTGCQLYGVFAEAQSGLPALPAPDNSGAELQYSTVKHIKELDDLLGADVTKRGAKVSQAAGGQASDKQRARVSPRVLISLALMVLIGFAGVLLWERYSGEHVEPAPIVLDDFGGRGRQDEAKIFVDAQPDMEAMVSVSAQVYSSAGGCDTSQSQQLKLQANGKVESLPYKGLCSLHWRSPSANTLLAIALDRLSPITLNRTAIDWQVPLPAWAGKDRTYIIIAVYDQQVEPLSEALNLQLLRWDFKGQKIDAGDIARWLEQQGVKANLFEHTIMELR